MVEWTTPFTIGITMMIPTPNTQPTIIRLTYIPSPINLKQIYKIFIKEQNKLQNNFIMKKEQIFGIIRHALTFVGGILVTKGLVEEAMVQEIIGTAVSLFGLVWSVVSKKEQTA